MKIIKSTNGYDIKVDAEDFEWLSKWDWQAVEAKNGERRVRRQFRENGKMKHVSMHRVIMKAKKGQLTDHVNHDQLDNRKHNLRVCTHQQNCRNKKIQRNNKSGFKGVSFQKGGGNRKKPWVAQISIDRKPIHLGYYLKPEDAYEAYKKAAKKYFGKFAYTYL